MISAKEFKTFLISQGLTYFTGVPDSILKNFLAEINELNLKPNEGSAIAAACGHYLATQNPGVVYMQNSGLGNAVNPLASLSLVYEIPMLLFIGWRGEGDDEPQHQIMGKATAKILESLGIEYDILSIDLEKARSQIINAVDRMKTQSKPYAFLVRKNTFEGKPSKKPNQASENREEIMRTILEAAQPEDKFFATTGYTGRELYKVAKDLNKLHQIFLGTGAMGHISQIALEYSLNSKAKVFCLEGDGSLSMHLGNTLNVFEKKPDNFKYLILNNESHLSVGTDESLWTHHSIKKTLSSLGARPAKDLSSFLNSKKFSFLEIICKNESSKDLPRPIETPIQLKEKFTHHD